MLFEKSWSLLRPKSLLAKTLFLLMTWGLLVPAVFAVDINIDGSVDDDTGPNVATITSHTNGTDYTSATLPTEVTGTAADDAAGLGLNANSTTFSLQRTSDGLYWNGTSWIAGPVYLPTTHPATNTNTIANWTSSGSLPVFDPGDYTLTARATDKAGNTFSGTPVGFSVIDTTVAPPVITSPTEGQNLQDSTPTITGTGIPGATVTVTITTTGDVYNGIVVQPDGTWSVNLTTPLPDSNHTAEAVQEVGGNTSAADKVNFTVGLSAPEITSPTEGQNLQDSTPTITGTGIPGATVTVTITTTGDVYNGIVVQPDGTWSVNLTTPLPDGNHTAEAVQELNGLTSPADTVDFSVGIFPPEITSPTSGQNVTDSTPTITGTGIPGANITVTIIETGEILNTVVLPDGTWSVTPAIPLPIGSNEITAIQEINGLTSDPISLTFNVTSPAMGNFITNIPGSDQANNFIAALLALAALLLSVLPAILSLPIGLPTYLPLFNLFSIFIGWLKKRRRYGIVYDSVTREGIEGATVRLFAEGGNDFEMGKLIESRKTDEKGRYTFNVQEGVYRLETIMPDFHFPSNRSSVDYRGELVKSDEGLLHPDIPMDNLVPSANRKLVNFRALGERIQQLRLPLMLTGTILAIAYLVDRSATIDYVIIGLYIILWTLEIITWLANRNVSYVYTEQGPAPLVILRLHDETGRLQTTRVTNLRGQYSIFTSSGKFLLDALKSAFDPQSHEVTMKNPGILPKRIKLNELPEEMMPHDNGESDKGKSDTKQAQKDSIDSNPDDQEK